MALQIASGRPRLATYALPHSTGAAVGFVILLIGLRRCTEDVEKERVLYGMPLSNVYHRSSCSNHRRNAAAPCLSYLEEVLEV